MRVLLVTGNGGAGTTTAAAATAGLIASRGRKALLVSLGAPEGLARAVGAPVTGSPTEVDSGLYAVHADPVAGARQGPGVLRAQWLDTLGLGDLLADELAALPGAPEILGLLELRAQLESDRFDVVVVDCGPGDDALRLLSLPEMLLGTVDRVFPAQHRVLLAGPLLGRVAVPFARARAVGAQLARLEAALNGVRAALTGLGSSVRLVVTPDAAGLAAARRLLPVLALYGHRVDGIIVNKVFTTGSDPVISALRDAQTDHLTTLRRELTLAGTSLTASVRELAYRAVGPVGPDALTGLGGVLYGGSARQRPADPAGEVSEASMQRVERRGAGFALVLTLPLLRREHVELGRRGDDLVVGVQGHRRRIALRGVLSRCVVTCASVSPPGLRVRFQADPDQWPDALVGAL